MRRVACWLLGHKWVSVSRVGAVARPGGILPSLDGLVAYKPNPKGLHLACSRCRLVDPVEYPAPRPDVESPREDRRGQA